MIRLASDINTTFAPYSNICPISGWTGANVVRTGKNLFKYNKTNATAAVSDYILLDNTLKFKNFGDAINSGSLTVYFYDENKNEQSYTRLTYNIPSGATYTIEPVSGTKYIRFTSYRTVANGGIDAYISAQFMVAEDVENYEPYTGADYSITFPQSAGTVYGGELTVNKDGSGELVVDKRFVTLSGVTFIDNQSSGNKGYYIDKGSVGLSGTLQILYSNYCECYENGSSGGF
jgi:hypothetical protein